MPLVSTDIGRLKLLGLFRIGLCILLIQILLSWNSEGSINIFEVTPTMWQPISIAKFFTSMPTEGYFQLVQGLALFSTIVLALGIFTRFSGVLAFVTCWLYMVFTLSFGKIAHATQPLMTFFFIMLFSDWGKCFSIDSLIRRNQKKALTSHPTPYVDWPFWLCTFMLSLFYLSSALFKLMRGHFLDENSMASFLEYYKLFKGNTLPAFSIQMINWVHAHPIFIDGMILFAFSVEFFFFIALFSTRFRLMMLGASLMLHGGLGVLVSAIFIDLINTLYLLLIPSLILELRARNGMFENVFPSQPAQLPDQSRKWGNKPVWLRTGVYFLTLLVIMLILGRFSILPISNSVWFRVLDFLKSIFTLHLNNYILYWIALILGLILFLTNLFGFILDLPKTKISEKFNLQRKSL